MIVIETTNVLIVQVRNGTFLSSFAYASVVIGSGIQTGGKRKTWPNSLSEVLTIQKNGTSEAAPQPISSAWVATEPSARRRRVEPARAVGAASARCEAATASRPRTGPGRRGTGPGRA